MAGSTSHINFTDLILQRIGAPTQGQLVFWDKQQRGLLFVRGTRTKTFFSKYKLNGKWQRRAIGRLAENTTERGHDYSVSAAREQCRLDRAMAGKGIDPCSVIPGGAGGKVVTRGRGLTVGDAIADFIENHCKRVQRTWDLTEGTLNRACAGWLDRQVSSITRDDLRALHKRYLDKGQESSAVNAHNWIKTMWAWLLEHDKIAADVLAPVKLRLAKAHRTEVYSDGELAALWLAAGKLDRDYGHFARFTRLMMLLVPRKTALAMMTWGDLDSERTVWTTPAELVKQKKTERKPRTYRTPLSDFTRSQIPPVAPPPQPGDRVFGTLNIFRTPAGRPVFTSQRLERHLVAAGAPAVSFHKLRHTMATWLENNDHNDWEQGLVLNHKRQGVTAGYNHGLAMNRKRELLAKWEKHLLAVVRKAQQPRKRLEAPAEGVAVLR